MPDTVHATCVAWAGRGVLIKGGSGSGKSTLALQLMAFGCDLVADDRVILRSDAAQLIANCPKAIVGQIEAYGIGILRAAHIPDVVVQLVVDLDQTSGARMPTRQTITLLGCELPLIYKHESPNFAAAILQILKTGFSDA